MRVQAFGGLVHHQHRRASGQGDGGHRALGHAARQLPGVVAACAAQARSAQHLFGLCAGGAGGLLVQQAVHLGQLRRHAGQGVECQRGLLRQQRQLAAPQGAARGGVLGAGGGAIQRDLARGLQCRRQVAHDGLGQQRLARAAFAHQGQRLARPQAEADVAQQPFAAHLDAQALHDQQGVGFERRGHAVSRSGLSSIIAATSHTSRAVGAAMSHGASS